MENDSGSKLSRVVGLKLTQLVGLYMENPSRHLIRVNSSFSPLYSSASILAKAAGVSGPFRPQREASSSHYSATWEALCIGVAEPLVLWKSPLPRLLIIGLGERLCLAHQLTDFRAIFLLEAPRAPAVAFLQWNA